MVEIHFLPVKTTKSQPRTKREIELDKSDIRSHAARISHHHAGRGRGRGRGRGHSMGRSVSKSSSSESSPSPEWMPAPSPLEAAVVHSGTLDPFFPLPVALDSYERFLLQHYLNIEGKATYRLTESTLYCPMRDANAAEIASNGLLIRWVVYLSSAFAGDSKTAVLSRRADIYAQMIKMLGSPKEARTEAALMVLLAAAVTEYHCGNVALTHKHWAGVFALLQGSFGGLMAVQRISFAKGTALVEGVLMQYVPLFETKSKLREALAKLRVPRARVSVNSMLWKYLGSNVQGWSERDIAFHLANLHVVSMMTVSGASDGFMKELVMLIQRGGDEITPTGITNIICRSALRAGEWYGENPRLRFWETLVFARLIMFATRSRDTIIRVMSAPLLGRSRVYFDLDVLKWEIEAGWEVKHGVCVDDCD